MLIDAKTKFFQDKISENKKDKKVLYNIVSSTIGVNTENPMPPGNSNIEVANSFANFFINKIQNIHDKLEIYSHFEPIHKDIPIPLNCFHEISKEELVKLVNSLHIKSCELDPLPIWFIKENLEEFLDVLLKLVNTSLTNSEFISDWKIAILSPLLKKANLDLEDCNYRLVSNLTFISKLMEKAMLHQIEEHLDLNMLNITYQLAYRKYHSCETALIKFMHDILWNMEKGKITTSIAIDFSTAFDTVDHYILIQTLEQSFGVHSVALNWFKEYLRDRKFKVCVDGDYSEIKTFNFCIPQGSCSGPQLYCLYSGSIRNVVLDNIDPMAFADDHTLYSTFDPNKKSGEYVQK